MDDGRSQQLLNKILIDEKFKLADSKKLLL